METDLGGQFKSVFSRLRMQGFLLLSDPKLPSVCSLIAGQALKTSWWSHPMAQAIFKVNGKLEDHPDVLVTKLISGKVTFVHRKLWAHILVIGSARESWQMKHLSAEAGKLLKTLDKRGCLRSDKMDWPKSAATKPAAAVSELEKKLLINAEQIHTETGAHAKQLESWAYWAKRREFKSEVSSVATAKQDIEDRLSEMIEEFGATAQLPWT